VNKLLHGPVVTLKSEAQSQNGFAFIEAARRFFELREREIYSGEDLLLEDAPGDVVIEETLPQKDGM
jgi:hypothetical protein